MKKVQQQNRAKKCEPKFFLFPKKKKYNWPGEKMVVEATKTKYLQCTNININGDSLKCIHIRIAIAWSFGFVWFYLILFLDNIWITRYARKNLSHLLKWIKYMHSAQSKRDKMWLLNTPFECVNTCVKVKGGWAFDRVD